MPKPDIEKQAWNAARAQQARARALLEKHGLDVTKWKSTLQRTAPATVFWKRPGDHELLVRGLHKHDGADFNHAFVQSRWKDTQSSGGTTHIVDNPPSELLATFDLAGPGWVCLETAEPTMGWEAWTKYAEAQILYGKAICMTYHADERGTSILAAKTISYHKRTADGRRANSNSLLESATLAFAGMLEALLRDSAFALHPYWFSHYKTQAEGRKAALDVASKLRAKNAYLDQWHIHLDHERASRNLYLPDEKGKSKFRINFQDIKGEAKEFYLKTFGVNLVKLVEKDWNKLIELMETRHQIAHAVERVKIKQKQVEDWRHTVHHFRIEFVSAVFDRIESGFIQE